MHALTPFRRYPAQLLASVSVLVFAAFTGCEKNPASPAQEEEFPTFFTSITRQKIQMVQIPGGSFLMGSDSGRAEEAPPHTVKIDPFRISAGEITNNLFAEFLNHALMSGRIKFNNFGAVVAASGVFRERLVVDLNTHVASEFQGPILFSNGVFSVKSGWRERPAVRVTWYGAALFAESRDMRLPTEAEWEYAARGGLGYLYATAGGELNPENSWYGRDEEYPVPVKTYPPNPFGLYDMTGNAGEWCQDWFSLDYYSRSPDENPTGPQSGFYRSVRGGLWREGAFIQRNAYRGYEPPENANEFIGFRVVQAGSTPN